MALMIVPISTGRDQNYLKRQLFTHRERGAVGLFGVADEIYFTVIDQAASVITA